MLLADAVNAELRVAVVQHALSLRTAQDVDDMTCAVAFLSLREARDTGKKLLSFGRAVFSVHRRETVVARGTRGHERFAEILKLHCATTFCGLCVSQHLAELLTGNALLLHQRFTASRIDLLLNQELGTANVAWTEIQDAVRRITVAPWNFATFADALYAWTRRE